MPVKYSIIVPVYNCEPYLKNCVDSILSQTYGLFELLLIDDGSTDKSGEICDTLANSDERIRVFHKANGGAADARNYGLNLAEGAFVLFIDGDDTVSPDCLQMVDSIAAEDTLGIFGMSFDCYQGNSIIRRDLLSCKYNGVFSPKDIACDFSGFFIDNQLSSACNKVFDRHLIEKLHLRFAKGMTLYEDFDFVIRYLMYTSFVSIVPTALYHYRLSSNNDHFKRRISKLEQLQGNLSTLGRTLLSFFRHYPERQVLSVYSNLYIQMLDQHLLQRPRITKESLQKELLSYCSNAVLEEAIELGGELNGAELRLFQQVQAGDFPSIAAHYRKRQLKLRIKRFVKRIVRK